MTCNTMILQTKEVEIVRKDQKQWSKQLWENAMTSETLEKREAGVRQVAWSSGRYTNALC